jgi:very-short-patch-repair endonuclease
MRPGHEYPNPGDTRLAVLAAKQHGVVGRAQLLALGYTKQAIHTRATTGRLHRVHRGVYAVGHSRLSLRGRWMAAVLACGPGAVLSHGTAAALYGLRSNSAALIDVTATSKHSLNTVRCHHVRRLHPQDATAVEGIAVTTIPRLLLDLAETLHPQRLQTTIEAVQRQDLLNLAAVDATIARSAGRHGIRPLIAALNQLRDEAPWTQSELERAFLELIREAGLPEPQCNVVVDGLTVDFYWPRHNLIVEVDGYRFHNTRRSFEDDRRRDAIHTIAGRRVLRVTHQRIVHGRAALTRDLARLLSR